MSNSLPCPADECLLRLLRQEEQPNDPIVVHLETCENCNQRLKRLAGPNSAQVALFKRQPPQPLPPEVPGYAYERDEAGFPLRLGEGGFGTVYAAVRSSDGQRVAIKWLKVDARFDTPERAAFLREATTALSPEMAHANLVQALEVNAIDNRFYYVMEYVEPGQDLHAWQGDKPLLLAHPDRFREIAVLLVQLAEGLAVAHRLSLVHRDLSYRNILVQARRGSSEIQRLKICDFGLARPQGSLEPSQRRGQYLGVLPFLAPELFGATPTITPAVDIYSLGVLGYYMLSGRTPYPSHDARLPTLIRQGAWTPLGEVCPDVPADLETILGKCLRTKPQDRYTRAEEVIYDLERFRQGLRIRSWRNLRCDRVATFTRNQPLLSAMFTTVTILLVLSAGLGGFAGLQWWRAERNGQEARRNERLALQETRQRLTASARAALKRGDLANAELFFDRAIEISPPQQQRELAFERLPTLTPYGRWDRLQAELERLALVEELTSAQRARLLLYQADYDLMDSIVSHQTRGKKRLREALALGLPPAEAAYARGLLANGFTAAIAEFEKVTAPTADPFHYRGNCCLLACYLLSGRFDEARQRADWMERVFGQEPIVPLMRGVMATLQRDGPMLALCREQLRQQVPPEQSKQMLAMLTWLDNLTGQAPKGNGLVALAQPVQFVGIRLGDIPRHVGVGLPVWHFCFDQVTLMLSGYSWTALGWYDAADLDLRKAAEMSPEGFIRFQQGVVTFHRLGKLLQSKRSNPQESTRLCQLASQQFREASQAPTLFPFLPFRRQAVWLRFVAEVSQRGYVNLQQEPAQAVAWMGLSPLHSLGPLIWCQQRRASGLEAEAFAQLLQADPVGDREIRPVLLPGLLANVCTPEEGRLLLQRWMLDEPANPQPGQLLTTLKGGP